MSLREKNINFKLFAKSVQFTGCKTIEQAQEANGYILKHLSELHKSGVSIYSDVASSPENEQVQITGIEVTMRNFDFHLGFKVNRARLAQLMNGRNGFITIYKAGITNGVSVKALINPEPDEIEYTPSGKVKRKKPKTHSFIVFGSGSVIQSGKHFDKMEAIYYKFRDTILEIEDEIKEDFD